ncbi:MAG TPA: tetratricopeptide repeat protein [Usitatibacter sp.]|jgi:CRISPR-associated protein Csy1|nr:tetratricopeptide repeat protein [Usitatibacter sp.]
MTQERLDAARAAYQKGDLAAAIQGYDAVLGEEPTRADVWHLKALALHQSGQLDAAQASIAHAIEQAGPQPGFLMLEAALCQDRGDLASAEARLAAVVAARPDWAGAHVELGSVHVDQGRVEDALRDFQAAVNADPRHVRGWNNLGIALLALGRTDEALRAFNYTLALDAAYPVAHFNLARIHQQRGDTRRALEHAQAAVRARPGYVEAWLLVGDLHRRNRETVQALAAYASAVRANPDHIGARTMRAELVAEAGGYAEALAEYRRIAQRAPAHARAALGANLLLPQVYESGGDVDRIRMQYSQGLERLQEAAAGFRYPNADVALDEMRWTNFYLAYQGRNDRELQRRYGEFHRTVLAAAAPDLFAPRERAAVRERIRVGFLSHFFFNCTAGRYFSSWITRLDPGRFESFVYYTNEWMADDTRTIAAAASTFRHLAGRSLGDIARQVVADELDVLVYPELGMHPDTFTLAGLRLAPVQCAGWGHPNTTGLPEIDWFISCAEMEPADAQDHYTERLALLPGLGTRYATPRADATGERGDYGIPEDRTAYLVPQSIFKIHPDNDDLIAEVLQRDARGVAVMFASHHDRLTQAFAARLGRALEKRGVDIHERVVFLAPFLPHGRYLRLNALCDVMLDTVHWSGGNTSLDAFASDLPVVTWPGALMRGRQSRAMLQALGAPQLVCESREAYVETALEVGRDREFRAEMSRRIAAGRASLFEREEPIRALEAFLVRAATQG